MDEERNMANTTMQTRTNDNDEERKEKPIDQLWMTNNDTFYYYNDYSPSLLIPQWLWNNDQCNDPVMTESDWFNAWLLKDHWFDTVRRTEKPTVEGKKYNEIQKAMSVMTIWQWLKDIIEEDEVVMRRRKLTWRPSLKY